jgi:Domain of unknown function DUF1828
MPRRLDLNPLEPAGQPSCEQIEERIGRLFTCSTVNGYLRIRTPYLYPDGDIIDLFLKQEGNVSTLTDLGETLGWLRTQSIAPRRSPRQNQLIADICLNHGVELFSGALTIRVKPSDDLSSAVIRLAQAALRVSDLWFTMRTRAVESVADEVGDFLSERKILFERGEKLPGRSGRAWTVDFHIRHPHRSALMCVLSTANRATASRITEHVASFVARPELSKVGTRRPRLSFPVRRYAGRVEGGGFQAG